MANGTTRLAERQQALIAETRPAYPFVSVRPRRPAPVPPVQATASCIL